MKLLTTRLGRVGAVGLPGCDPQDPPNDGETVGDMSE